ncbi:MAG: response regulator [Deltaproteobacteria bacterium]|nr:response regulator [Deltaproteobacteria bacterium]
MSIETTDKANILIVDDTVETLQLLTVMLKNQGYETRPVSSGKSALQAASDDPPDLILLDINMPQMNGYEVCQRLKASDATKEIPVIFISAYNQTPDKVRAFGAGGVDYVTKPFQLDEVLARVKAHLSLRRLQLQLEAKNRKLEASLARQQELEQIKERLVQMIVHDLKSPLAAIAGNADYLIEEIQGNGDAADAVGDIADSAQSMHRMVLNILDVIQLEEKGLQPRRASVDLAKLVDSAAATIGRVAQKAGRTIEVRPAPGLPKVPFDPNLIQRLLENLLDNSLRHAPRGTAVVIEFDVCSEGEVAIDVYDRGPRVPRERKNEIFEPHARMLGEADVDPRISKGLGLAFCKLAVEAHGGRIWVDDNQPQGAVFRIRIPVTPPSTAAFLKGKGNESKKQA